MKNLQPFAPYFALKIGGLLKRRLTLMIQSRRSPCMSWSGVWCFLMRTPTSVHWVPSEVGALPLNP
jgi:hypothetical protein